MSQPPNRHARRALAAERGDGAEIDADALLDTLVGVAQTVKRGLPLGWDVTLIATRHKGDGRATTQLASTLPAQVRDAVLMGLGDSLKAEYAEQKAEGEQT